MYLWVGFRVKVAFIVLFRASFFRTVADAATQTPESRLGGRGGPNA